MEFKLYLFPQHADILAQLLVKKHRVTRSNKYEFYSP